jgi:hypothetical protein
LPACVAAGCRLARRRLRSAAARFGNARPSYPPQRQSAKISWPIRSEFDGLPEPLCTLYAPAALKISGGRRRQVTSAARGKS